ncbi:hypothetical protein [Leptothoe kymatousa]|uniref:Uncharacterized protein n=1 Tax=Leptothoe kymatousa TAU-MAC 1615 TaxID=2364775 RepID=A0ABS5Y2D5_9CYAN|nr:hypothetical protein [Leptothoe kymatousa]MBT9312003.1 hypothetical protein [Leptothoe kymatousa TAU-MAC 1615]
MGTWIKETDKAIYLMDGAYYLQKIDKTAHTGQVEGETFFRTGQLKTWLNSKEPPGFFLVSVGTGVSEPQPLPPPPAPPLSQGITITKSPSQVKIYQPYQVAGTASTSLVGKTVELYIDNSSSPAAKTTINDNQQWLVQSVFIAVPKPQVRNLKVVAGDASDVATLTLTPYIEDHPGGTKLNLGGSVGSGGSNRASDVRKVQERLIALGYTFANKNYETFVQTIRLFQSIISGRTAVRGVDGRIDVNGRTQRFLEAANAPQWMLMPSRGVGFYNLEVIDQPWDKHDYGIDWMSNVIKAAGIHYELAYRKNREGIAPIAVNDVSLPQGGDTIDHAGHETGNAGDLALPRLDGDFGGITWSDRRYDRPATKAVLEALRAQPWVNKSTLYFNDPVLINQRLCSRAAGHDNHIHFEVMVPPTP